MGEFDAFGAMERAGWADASRAGAYVALFASAADQAAAAMAERLAPKPGEAVLDLCCGQGHLTALLAATGAETTGLDFSTAMLAHAHARLDGVTLVEGDAQALPFADVMFDAVACNCGILHIPDQPKALAEVARVLKPGGRFAMSVWSGPDISPAFRIAYTAIKCHASPDVVPPPQPDFHRFARAEIAEAILGAAGLRDVALETVDCAWTLAAPEDLYEIYAKGTVRAAMILQSQPAESAAAIRAAIAEAVARDYAAGTGFRVPVPAALITARR